MTQHEVKRRVDLLDQTGNLIEPGWARTPQWQYDAGRCRNSYRTPCEWDFFTVMNPNYIVNFNMANLGVMRVCTIDLMDLINDKRYVNARYLGSEAGLNLSNTPRQNASVEINNKKLMQFELGKTRNRLSVDMKKWLVLPDFKGEFDLDWPEEDQAVACAFPFPEQPGGFFYEFKVPAIPAQGALSINGKKYILDKSDTFAVLDWARGVWPKREFWRWGAFATRIKGVTVGMNLGNGFGDQSRGTENALTVDGITHKLGQIDWKLDRRDYSRPWEVNSHDGRVQLSFHPTYVDKSNLELLVFGIKGRRIFGYFSGSVVLDDGSKLDIPAAFGFGEEVWIHW